MLKLNIFDKEKNIHSVIIDPSKIVCVTKVATDENSSIVILPGVPPLHTDLKFEVWEEFLEAKGIPVKLTIIGRETKEI